MKQQQPFVASRVQLSPVAAEKGKIASTVYCNKVAEPELQETESIMLPGPAKK
jgi:hypothetical protein